MLNSGWSGCAKYMYPLLSPWQYPLPQLPAQFISTLPRCQVPRTSTTMPRHQLVFVNQAHTDFLELTPHLLVNLQSPLDLLWPMLLLLWTVRMHPRLLWNVESQR